VCLWIDAEDARSGSIVLLSAAVLIENAFNVLLASVF